MLGGAGAQLPILLQTLRWARVRQVPDCHSCKSLELEDCQMRSAAQHDADNICRRPHAGSRQDSAMLNVRSMSMLPR